MEENLQCYTFKKFTNNNGFFDDIVEATYIIHLKDNGRIDRIHEQLQEYQPTKIIYIVYNEGFKKCVKSEFIQNSVSDLIDVNLQILKHSKKMNYDNILVLEDDFIFSKKIKENFHKNNIISFLKNNNYKPYYYLLGCAPMLQIPYDYYNYRPILSGGAHAVIYNSKMKDIILNCKQENMKDWDDLGIWLNHRYTYYIPLCYQLFPETENSKFWGVDDNFITRYIKQSGKIFLKLLNMDQNVEPGYSILYIFSKIIFFLIILIVIVFILKVYNIVFLNKSIVKINKGKK
jgi:hypothetical protein